MLALFVLALFLSVVVLSAVALGIWDQMKRQSCRDVLREEEYAPYIFDSSLGESSRGRDFRKGGIGEGVRVE